MPRTRPGVPGVKWVIVVGPEVVGTFDTEDDAHEWAEAFIDESANYKGYMQPPQWYVASFTDARGYEREVEPTAPRSPWVRGRAGRTGRSGAHRR